MTHNIDNKGRYIGIEKYIFSDVYSFCTKYITRSYLSDNDWQSVMIDAKCLVDKYKGNELCRSMVLATIGNFEFKFNGTIDSNGMTYSHFDVLNRTMRM